MLPLSSLAAVSDDRILAMVQRCSIQKPRRDAKEELPLGSHLQGSDLADQPFHVIRARRMPTPAVASGSWCLMGPSRIQPCSCVRGKRWGINGQL